MGYTIERFYKGLGCRKCRNTGYSGRVGVHELMPVNDELRDAIVAGGSVIDLRRIAGSYGMVTLRHDGFRKVREGLTSVEEVIQISGEIPAASEKRPAGVRDSTLSLPPVAAKTSVSDEEMVAAE
jgi:type IV pilus assembly protein PilB